MDLKKQNILFFTRTMGLGGTENIVLQLCEIFKGKVNKIVVCSHGGVKETVLKKLGIRHYTISDIENKDPATVVKTLSMVSSIIANEKITVIHSHHRMAAFYSNAIPDARNCVKIATVHNTFFDKRFLTKLAYRNTHLVACGEMVKQNLCGYYGLPSAQVAVVPNAVKEFTGKICSVGVLSKYREEGCFLIGNVGRLSPQKGMEYFIQAAPEILEKYPKTKFFIIGDGEEKKRLMELVSSLSLINDVFFLGYRTDIQNVMSQLDLIVLSSLWEGLPLTPLEAFSVGKTVVGTAVDGTPEIIRDNVNGCLVAPKDSHAIAEKVILLQEKADLRIRLERNALLCFKKNFSIYAFRKAYVRLYEELPVYATKRQDTSYQ